MKGISIFIATIILIAFVIAVAALTTPFVMDLTKSKEAGVEEKGKTAIECGMGALNIESLTFNGNLKVTIENLGQTDLSGLKIVAYNQSGSYTYDATPSSISVGSKLTISSDIPGGTVTKIKVLTNCPTVSDEYDTGFTSTTTTTTTTIPCGTYINFNTVLDHDVTDCTGTIFYINASDVTLDCNNHYLQSGAGTDIPGINNTNHTNVTIKNCEINMSDSAGDHGIYYKNADDGTIENNTVTVEDERTIYLQNSSNNIISNNIPTAGDLYAIYLFSSSNNNTITNNTATVNINYAIYLESSYNNTISNNNATANNYAIYFEFSSNNTISNNNATVNGINAIVFFSSSDNNITNNTATANSDNAIAFFSSSNNTISNNNATANNYAIYLYSSSNNNITGGSIKASIKDYYIRNAGSTNSFRDTNFTAEREIYFYDTTSWFNYNNQSFGGIWLNTSVNSSNTLTRELASWMQSLVQWNDTGSVVTAYYNLSGLYEDNYDIYDNDGYEDTIYAANGELEFSINLSGEHKIEVGWNPCFLVGTKIIMFGGSEKNIEDVKEGDLVLSYNLEKGRYEKARVTRTFEHGKREARDYYFVINDNLKVTPNHPVYVNGEWKAAGSLKMGDRLFTGKVESIERVYKKKETYNLEVERNHNYFAEGVLVHNK